MSDDNLAQEMNEELLPENLEQLASEQQEAQPDLSPAEQKAWDDGWRPEDEFEGKPENWKTAEAYNLYGEFQVDVRAAKAETRRVQQEADERFANLNKYHEGKRKAEIADLRAQQRQAVEEADTARFDQLEKQIENTAAVETTTPQVDPTIADWNTANPWINDGSDKAQDAQGWYQRASVQPGATAQSVLAYVDKRIAEVYPEQQTPTNPRREMPSMAEQSHQPRQRQRAGKELTMNDLTAQESKEYEQFGKEMFKDEKQFLKSVADARKG
jgi:hypothetical protein